MRRTIMICMAACLDTALAGAGMAGTGGAAADTLPVAGSAEPGVLTTAPANNGAGGIFLRLQAVDLPLRLLAIDTPIHGNSGIPVQVQVWTRPGSYIGHVDDEEGWTLSQTLTGLGQGSDQPAPFDLEAPIIVPVDEQISLYLQSVTEGAGIRYTGNSASSPQISWNNGDIVLFSNTAMGGHVPFAGTPGSPRTFSGSLHYLDNNPIFADGFDTLR